MTRKRWWHYKRWQHGIYHWIDRRGSIPSWMRLVWRKAHWCPDMDGLLILGNTMDCFCGHVKKSR